MLIIPVLILYPVRVRGKRNIPKKGKVIITCNHQSNHDGVIFVAHSPRRVKIMAKQELFSNKIKAWFMKCIGAYAVKRGGNDISSIKQTMQYLKQDKALLIFPEGTRVKEGEAGEVKNGTALFALKTKTAIVPTCFVKPTGFFKRNTLMIGKPYMLSDMPEFKDKPINKELLDSASKIISEHTQALREEYANRRDKNVKRHRNSKKRETITN